MHYHLKMKKYLTLNEKRKIKSKLKEIVLSSDVPNNIKNRAFTFYEYILTRIKVAQDYYRSARIFVEQNEKYLNHE